MADNLRRDSDRRALEACRKTRDEAAAFLDAAPGNVSNEQAAFLRSVVERMDIAITAFEARASQEPE
jgi:hypothetical protein